MAEQADIAIVGGGMVGMGCALAMAQLGFDVVLLEAQTASGYMQAAPVSLFDDRTLVVNPASKNFWESLGIWQRLAPKTVPIKKVHVSNQGHFGVVNFSAADFNVSELGAVVGAKDMVSVLWDAVNSHERIKVKTSATLQSFRQYGQGTELQVKQKDNQLKLHARLMLACDGARSQIRTDLGLKSQVKSYDRTVIVCNAQFEKVHNHCAFERLTKTGPLALLPFHHGHCGMVWSVDSVSVAELLAMDDDNFMAVLQKQLSHRLGKLIQVGRRSTYPLYQVKVQDQIAQSVVLMGNAAHTVSPVSAQGLNLAVRGIQRLSKVLKDAQDNKAKLSDFALLEKYQFMSAQDQQATMDYTDDLMTWFKMDAPWVNSLRSAGLVFTDALPAAKRYLFERAGGLKA